MFCKKCGNIIKAGAEFCPKCGERVSGFVSTKINLSGSLSVPTEIKAGPEILKLKNMSAKTKKFLLVVAGVIAFLIVLSLIFRIASGIFGGEKVTYSLEGTWTSEDVANIEKSIRNLLVYEAGVPDWTVDMIMEATGAEYLGDAYITFSEDGSLWFGGGGTGLAVSVGSFSYEKISDYELLLKYSLSIPIVGDISASYQADYSVSKDRLTLDLFGITVKFKRQE